MSAQVEAGAQDDRVYRALFFLARWFAILGGAILVAIGMLTVASVLGRYFFAAPIRGDFELVEMGCAYAVYLFLPYCQLIKGNVIVDFFTARAPVRVHAALDSVGGLFYVLIAVLLTWRIWVGAANLRQTGETTIILGLPLGWVVLVGAICFGFVALVALYTTWRDLTRMVGRRPAQQRRVW